MNKRNILKNIRELSFSSDLSPIFSILENHLNRVEFTKDYAGLRDFLYITEEIAAEEYPFFACLDFNEENQFDDDGVYNEVIYDVPEICKQLKRFFSQFNRPLYVSVGFKDSILSSEDMLYMHTLLDNKIVKDKVDAELKLRKFPDWYIAKYPNEILEDAELIEIIKSIKEKEQILTECLKEDILKQIDTAIDNNDKESFYFLTAKLNKIINNKIDQN